MCYQVLPTRNQSWTEARDSCLDAGATIHTIQDLVELRALQHTMGASGYEYNNLIYGSVLFIGARRQVRAVIFLC